MTTARIALWSIDGARVQLATVLPDPRDYVAFLQGSGVVGKWFNLPIGPTARRDFDELLSSLWNFDQ